MKIIIEGTTKEIADLTIELRGQQKNIKQQDFELDINDAFTKKLNQKSEITNLDELARATLTAHKVISRFYSK